MLRHNVEYRTRYYYRDISIQELEKFISTVKTRLETGLGRIDIRSIEPEEFNREYNASWEKFRSIFLDYYKSIRTYSIYFSSQKMGGRAPADFVFVKIVVCLQGKFGEDTGKEIELCGCACYPNTYKTFVEIAVQELSLKEAPPPGMDFEDESILHRWQSGTKDSSLITLTEGAIKTKQYDVAVKAAISLVESRLREKCMAAGSSNAKHQAGPDLAVTAYHKDKGCLDPPWAIASEAQQGAQLLFQGFFFYLRNAYAHHSVVMGSDKSTAYECLAICEFLMKIVEKSVPR
jgi:hypothetical protein